MRFIVDYATSLLPSSWNSNFVKFICVCKCKAVEAYSEVYQGFAVKLYVKIANGFQSSTIFVKEFHVICLAVF